MVATASPATSVVTGEVRLSYAHLFEPFSNNPDQAEKYSVVLLIPKSDKKTLRDIKAAQAAAAEAGKGKHFGGKVPANLKTTLRDGDEEGDLERNPEYEGHYFMAVSSKKQPGIVNRQRQPILDANEVYSGCFARVAINAFAYNTQGNRGISFGLNHVQKLRDGEPLGGFTRAEDVFSALDDEDDDDLI